MEYLTIEEKASLVPYLSFLNEKIEQCKKYNLPYKIWETQREIFLKAFEKIKKQDSFELAEMRKTYENTDPCKH